MLKRKRELNYRRASERFERCKYCVYKKWVPIMILPRGSHREAFYYAWRCEVIGMDSSRQYNIQDDHVCDEYSRSAAVRRDEQ